MRSKSEAGTTLHRINWDFGVANEIFMYNAPEKTDSKTEIHIVARLSRMEVLTTKPYYSW